MLAVIYSTFFLLNVFTCFFLGNVRIYKLTEHTATIEFGHVFSVIGGTCVAMDEWVVQPQGQSHTALDDILPCADAAVTVEALRRSKEVNFQVVFKLNQLVSDVSNGNVSSWSIQLPTWMMSSI